MFTKKFIFLIVGIIAISVDTKANLQHSNFEKMLTVHKTATCGCCKMWVKHTENNGFKTKIKDHQTLAKIQDKYNIKPNTGHAIHLFQKMGIFLKVMYLASI